MSVELVKPKSAPPYQVASAYADAHAVVVCSCQSVLVVLRGLGHARDCPRCGAGYFINSVHFDAAAHLASGAPGEPPIQVNVGRVEPPLVRPASQLLGPN